MRQNGNDDHAPALNVEYKVMVFAWDVKIWVRPSLLPTLAPPPPPPPPPLLPFCPSLAVTPTQHAKKHFHLANSLQVAVSIYEGENKFVTEIGRITVNVPF